MNSAGAGHDTHAKRQLIWVQHMCQQASALEEGKSGARVEETHFWSMSEGGQWLRLARGWDVRLLPLTYLATTSGACRDSLTKLRAQLPQSAVATMPPFARCCGF